MSERPPAERHLWEFQAVRDLLAIVCLLGLIWLGGALSIITVPLLVALALAYLVEPLIGWLQGRLKWMTRRAAVVGIMGGSALAFLAVLLLVVPPAVSQTIDLVRSAPAQLRRVSAWATAEERPEWLRERIEPVARLVVPHQPTAVETMEVPAAGSATTAAASPVISAALSSPLVLDEERVRALIREELVHQQQQQQTAESGRPVASWFAYLGGASSRILAAAAGFLGGLVHFGIFLAVVAFAFPVFALNWAQVLATGRSLVPPSKQERVFHLVGRMDRVVAAFVRGRLLIASIVGLLYALGWTFCGVPYGFILGLAVGACSLVPYLAAVGLPLAWGLLIANLLGATDPTTSGYLTAGAGGGAELVWWKIILFPLLVNFIVQQIEDYVLNPLIQGKATDLHPVAIMVAVIAGGSLAGLYGMLLAVPAAACVRILGEEVLIPRLRAWAGRAADSA